MTTHRDLDGRLATWFAEEAPERAPDRLLEDSLGVVGLTTQRPARRATPVGRAVTAWRALSTGRRALLAAAALVALTGVVAAGALRLQEPPAPIPGLVTVRQADANDLDRGIVVLLDDGLSTRELARIDAGALGGRWNGWTAAIGRTGLLALGITGTPDDRVAVVDLRRPSVVRATDLPAYGAAWSPDGERVAVVDDRRLLTYDAGEGEYRQVPFPAGTSPMNDGYGPVWTTDGIVVIRGDSTIGVVRPDGSSGPLVSGVGGSGLGPRRVASDGSVVRCPETVGGPCSEGGRNVTTISDAGQETYTADDPTIGIVDVSWAIDGGLWLLTETVAPGPRTLTLVRVATGGSPTTTALELEAGADDPDPGTYCQGGHFGGLAPDDSRIVVVTMLDGCIGGATYLVDPASGSATVIDGVPAGWLDPDALARERLAAAPAPDAPDDVRGAWGRGFGGRDDLDVPEGPQRLEIGRGIASVVVGSVQFGFVVSGLGDDQLSVVGGDAPLDCRDDGPGTYRWHVGADSLSLTARDESCAARQALLEGTFERALPLAGNVEPAVTPGATYLWPEFGLRVTAPPDPVTTVWTRDGSKLELATADGGLWALERAPDTLSGGGIDAAIEARAELIRLVGRTETTVAGRPAITGGVTILAARGDPTSFWDANEGPGFPIREGQRVTIFEGLHGELYALVEETRQRPDLKAWADGLTSSIDFTGD